MRTGLDRTGGIVLNLVGQVMQNLAAVLMSFGQQGNPTAARKALWYVGVVLIVVGALAVFASYGVAEQSLLGSLISIQFVSNMVFCRIILGKPITLFMVVGTSVIIGGTLLCILNAPRVDHDLDEVAMERLYLRNPVFMRFLLGEAMVWILMDKLYSTYVDAQQRGQQKWGQEVMLPCMFVARAAVPGSFSVVAAKNLAVLLKIMTTEGRNMLGSPFLWLSLFFWLGGTGYWMRRMNHALALFNGQFIIPLCQVTWSCCTIVTGGVFFEEFKHFDWDNMLLFILGLIGNFAGVMMLQPRKRARVKDPEAQQTCPEETPADVEDSAKSPSPPSSGAYPPYRPRARSCSKTSNFSAGSLSMISSTSSPQPDHPRRSGRISSMGLIPLVLDGVTEERTESGPSTGRSGSARVESATVVEQCLMDRLVELENSQIRQHEQVLGKINELVSALQLPKGGRPVVLTTPSDPGTPRSSGATTPQVVPPDAPLLPSTPPGSAPLAMPPAEGPSCPLPSAVLSPPPMTGGPSSPPCTTTASPRAPKAPSPKAAALAPPPARGPSLAAFPARSAAPVPALPAAASPRVVGSPLRPLEEPSGLPPAGAASPPTAEAPPAPRARPAAAAAPPAPRAEAAEASPAPPARPAPAPPGPAAARGAPAPPARPAPTPLGPPAEAPAPVPPIVTPHTMPPVAAPARELAPLPRTPKQLRPVTLGKSGRGGEVAGEKSGPAPNVPCQLPLLDRGAGRAEAEMPGA